MKATHISNMLFSRKRQIKRSLNTLSIDLESTTEELNRINNEIKEEALKLGIDLEIEENKE